MSHEKEETIQIYQGWEEFYGIEVGDKRSVTNWTFFPETNACLISFLPSNLIEVF
jgi:hypothetical protein